MIRGRITRVRFAGLRTAASVDLDLGGLTILIGPNGVGKSSLIEGLELLRRVMISDDLVRAMHEDPAGSTVLCDLDEHRHLRLRRPDAVQLAKWLPEYRGVGQLRAEGYDSLVFPRPRQVAPD